MEQAKPKQNRGFRSMDPQRVREIASLGGRTAHANGRAHEFTSEEAREAGKKGQIIRKQKAMNAFPATPPAVSQEQREQALRELGQ